eukprot:TRINITY_DN13504_c0_g1_i1.p1 TRINITY_DN13504_c0_g1~~TRINITY_DN13504_c0_g1_i1.p1  ORF type:complete len:714 (-),score=115.86 TRINITY_DN13504_c0_g1_i1:19-2160(-)
MVCSREQFGKDAQEGASKSCWCAPTQPYREEKAYKCAEDGGSCECSGTVYFGDTSFTTLEQLMKDKEDKIAVRTSVRGSTPCSSGRGGFNRDPEQGVSKGCWCVPTAVQTNDEELIKCAAGALDSPMLARGAGSALAGILEKAMSTNEKFRFATKSTLALEMGMGPVDPQLRYSLCRADTTVFQVGFSATWNATGDIGVGSSTVNELANPKPGLALSMIGPGGVADLSASMPAPWTGSGGDYEMNLRVRLDKVPEQFSLADLKGQRDHSDSAMKRTLQKMYNKARESLDTIEVAKVFVVDGITRKDLDVEGLKAGSVSTDRLLADGQNSSGDSRYDSSYMSTSGLTSSDGSRSSNPVGLKGLKRAATETLQDFIGRLGRTDYLGLCEGTNCRLLSFASGSSTRSYVESGPEIRLEAKIVLAKDTGSFRQGSFRKYQPRILVHSINSGSGGEKYFDWLWDKGSASGVNYFKDAITADLSAMFSMPTLSLASDSHEGLSSPSAQARRSGQENAPPLPSLDDLQGWASAQPSCDGACEPGGYVWLASAAGYSCGAWIDRFVQQEGKSYEEAKRLISSRQPEVCGCCGMAAADLPASSSGSKPVHCEPGGLVYEGTCSTDGTTCGQEIEYAIGAEGYSLSAARNVVAGYYPTQCGSCQTTETQNQCYPGSPVWGIRVYGEMTCGSYIDEAVQKGGQSLEDAKRSVAREYEVCQACAT